MVVRVLYVTAKIVGDAAVGEELAKPFHACVARGGIVGVELLQLFPHGRPRSLFS